MLEAESRKRMSATDSDAGVDEISKDKILQAVEYFKHPGFHRIFEGLQERYASLSRLGGSIRLKLLTKEESQVLEGFLQKNILENSTVSISIAQIKKALANTRYAECSLEEIVPLVLKEKMVSKKQEREIKEHKKESFFDEISVRYQGTTAGNWLDSVLNTFQATKHPMLYQFSRDYNTDPVWLAENLPHILNAINRLPVLNQQRLRQPVSGQQHQRLPVFAAAVTGNPHYFDEGRRSLNYLLYAIRDLCKESYLPGDGIQARAGLLYSAGLLKDDLSNWVLCYGLKGYDTDGKTHKGMEEYLRRGEPLILTLQNLSLLQAVTPASSEVYVVENPSVFSWLMEQKYENFACICSGGQLRLAVLVVLDLLVKNDIILYYCGDFDPEGLGIAQKLVTRYGKRLKLWNYNEEIYHMSLSSETISDHRLKQLDSLTQKELIEVGDLLRTYRRAGYQENILECLKLVR